MSRVRAAISIFRSSGLRGVLQQVVARLAGTATVLPSALNHEDALAVDWSRQHPAVADPLVVSGRPLTVAFIMSPPSASSGGHQNIYRFAHYLEAAGHTVRIYLYSTQRILLPQVTTLTSTSSSYARLNATAELYTDAGVASDVDAIFATGWETAYPAFRDRSPARRLYFVQDFEPYFYPVGSDSVFAENTYRFGFEAVTAGGWLAGKLAAEYGMKTSYYDFSADRSNYHILDPAADRKEAFFYARPGTERRGFEMGVMALELFARERPDITINLGGWDVTRFKLPFAFNNLGSMPVSELNAVYNRCAAGLVLSMTNMSLLPLELLAAGVIPVVNSGPNNSQVSDNSFIEYSDASPRALADRLVSIFDRPDRIEHSVLGSASLTEDSWDSAGASFVRIVERLMRG